jgi:hypothetical protein
MPGIKKEHIDQYLQLVKAAGCSHLEDVFDKGEAHLIEAIWELQHIVQLKDQFLGAGNPVYAMQAFLYSRDRLLSLSSFVYEWLYAGFCQYQESGGKQRLDSLLGFKRKNFNAFNDQKKQERLFEHYHDFTFLKQALNLNNEETAKLYVEVCDWGADWSTLKDYYERSKDAKCFKDDDLVSGWLGDHQDPFEILDFLFDRIIERQPESADAKHILKKGLAKLLQDVEPIP